MRKLFEKVTHGDPSVTLQKPIQSHLFPIYIQWVSPLVTLVTLESGENTAGKRERGDRTGGNAFRGKHRKSRVTMGHPLGKNTLCNCFNWFKVVTLHIVRKGHLLRCTAVGSAFRSKMQSVRFLALQSFTPCYRRFKGLRKRHTKLNRYIHSVCSLVHQNRAVDRPRSRTGWSNVNDSWLESVNRFSTVDRLIGGKINIHSDSLRSVLMVVSP